MARRSLEATADRGSRAGHDIGQGDDRSIVEPPAGHDPQGPEGIGRRNTVVRGGAPGHRHEAIRQGNRPPCRPDSVAGQPDRVARTVESFVMGGNRSHDGGGTAARTDEIGGDERVTAPCRRALLAAEEPDVPRRRG